MKVVKKVLIVDGLCCGSCASKIEEGIMKLNGVKSVHLDFVTKQLFIIGEKDNISNIIEESKKIVTKIEAGAVINEKIKVKSKVMKNENHEHKHSKDCCNNISCEREKRVEKDVINEELNKNKVLKLILGSLIFTIGIVGKYNFTAELSIFLMAYIIIGADVLIKSLKNVLNGQIFDENFLMSIATIGAFSIGQFSEGVAVMLFYEIGEIVQDLAVEKSRKSIAELMDIRSETANVLNGEDVKVVSAEEVNIGEVILVRPGEKIPLDGEIIDGKSFLDTAPLTGESVLRGVDIGDKLLSGCINKTGLIKLRVTNTFEDSAVSKIIDMVQNASSKKAKTEKFITKFAKYYTPSVVVIAICLAVIPPLVFSQNSFSDWLYRALVFLVISCPCALVISIPLSFFGGIGGASRNGILVKGANYLEALKKTDTIVFDKTGTLTKGIFEVSTIVPMNGFSKEQLLLYTALCEKNSNHPIAISIMKYANADCGLDEINDYEELSGYGIKCKIDNKNILVGNLKLMKLNNIQMHEYSQEGTVVYTAIDNMFAGYIVISDTIKNDVEVAIEKLKSLGIKRIVMLTGDRRSEAESIAKRIGIEEVYYELLPDEKVAILEDIMKSSKGSGNTIFVGDGINDAPVLKRADIGVAMGGIGSDAAIEAADIVLMTDEPIKIVKSIEISHFTNKIVMENILIALSVKLLVLVLGAGGLATMWEAVFADVGVTLIAIINSLRVMNIKS